jgi:SEC-C motif
VDQERLTYLFGPGVLDVIDEYDLEDESDRMQLVDRYLALPPGAEQRGQRMAVRNVVVAQALQDDPPETWQTIERLRSLGLDRDEVVSQVTMVVSEHLIASLQSGDRFDREAYVAGLAELPLPGRDAVAQALIDVARASQGIGAEEHCDRALAIVSPTGSPLVESMIDKVLDHLIGGPLDWLPRDLTVHVADLVDGRTFTHRFNEGEAELDILTAGFDLGAFARFDTVRLADGTELDQFSVERTHLAWRGPEGWLAAFTPGDLLAVTATVSAPDGGAVEPVEATVTIERLVDEPELRDEAVRAVRDAYDEIVAEPGLPVSGQEIALWVCFHRSDLFRGPQRPLDELCEAAGLEQDGCEVAHDASIWRRDVWHRRFHAARAMTPEREWNLVLGRALERLDDPDASMDDVRASLAECAEPEVLDVLADVLVPHHLDPADEFERGGVRPPSALFDLVARATAVASRPREVATAEYLACVLDERCGLPDRAEEHLVRAVQAAPRLGPVVERMGWYRFDRGDAKGALRWWRQLGDPHPAAAVLESLRASDAGRRLGRNDPCWCGSGRKFKQCHQGATELPALPDRVAWLCRKASLWIEHSTGDQRQLVMDLMAARATGDADAAENGYAEYDEDELQDLFERAFADPIVFDVALHEGRLFRLFLDERGALLPDDEQLLVASWLTVDRSVHEVVAVEPGASMTVRDLATGEVVEVRERTASRMVQAGQMLCMRVVPDGAGHQMIGGNFGVRSGQEEAVLDLCAAGDPFELCAWAGAIAQPPRLVHQPGMLDSMIDREALDAAMAGVDGGDDDAVSAAVMAELGRQFQARWLDESVPALGGLTPRQAAADPTRRERVERLIDEFDRMGTGVYDTAALRRELGL